MKRLVLFALMMWGFSALAQNPFEKEILAYEKQDSTAMPAKGQWLFIGSSSFRLWKHFDRDMQGYPAFNRGFGGSTLADALYYFDRMVAKYQPSWVFMYEGDNDLAKGKTPEAIVEEFKEFAARLKKVNAKAHLVFVAARPSLARTNNLEKQRRLNALILDLTKGQKRWHYMDMHTPFFLPDGSLMNDIFVADRLHLNDKGYEIFNRVVQEFIKKEVK